MPAAKMNGAAARPTLDEIRSESERNHEVFRGIDVSLLGPQGDFALMKGGMVRGIFPTDADAVRAGESRYADRLYSVHRIRKSPKLSSGPAPDRPG